LIRRDKLERRRHLETAEHKKRVSEEKVEFEVGLAII
jgi:hypothetical protein